MPNIQLFVGIHTFGKSKKIRPESFRDEEKQKWYFSVIDVIEVLTESNRPRKYWSDLKKKLHTEGYNQLSEKIRQAFIKISR